MFTYSLRTCVPADGILQASDNLCFAIYLLHLTHLLSRFHATMLDYRGFSAWITSDDLELVEFEPRTNTKTHTVTCWIAGNAGKVREKPCPLWACLLTVSLRHVSQKFIVHWRDHGSHVDSASYIYFDGFKVSGQFLYGNGEELRRGVRVGSEEERPFVFSPIERSKMFRDTTHCLFADLVTRRPGPQWKAERQECRFDCP